MMNAASSINLSEESEHRQDHPSPSTLPLHHLSISAQSEGVKDSNDNDNKDVDLDKDCVQKAPPSEEVAKLASAATLIQSVYRGYQSRRELYGSALTASQKWRFLIDYSRIQHIHKMDAKDKDHLPQSPSLMIPDDPNQHPSSSSQAPNESRARWAWRRAEFLGSRLGKVNIILFIIPLHLPFSCSSFRLFLFVHFLCFLVCVFFLFRLIPPDGHVERTPWSFNCDANRINVYCSKSWSRCMEAKRSLSSSHLKRDIIYSACLIAHVRLLLIGKSQYFYGGGACPAH
ncbi:hypothetical protein EDD21DRAFT_360554 [Dissophora ornata]|nr:hypothetical protein EDD21DRAFT_360554 [Dissophora ornata]